MWAKGGGIAAIKIRTAASGDGTEVTTIDITDEETSTVYAAGYTKSGRYIKDVDVIWSWASGDFSTGDLTTTSGSTTTIDPTATGTGVLQAVYSQVMVDTTGTITVTSAGFTPSGAPVGHWPADEITGLEDGDPVGTWPDQSGNSYDLTQATGAAKPTYKTGIKNDNPVIRFDGADDTMCATLGAAISNESASFFIVTSPDTPSTARETLISLGDSCSDAAPFQNFEISIFFDKTPDWTILWIESQYPYDAADVSGWHIYSAILDDDLQKLYDQGSEIVSDTTAGAQSREYIIVSGRNASAQFWNGDIAEIIVYDTPLSDSNRQSNEAGLNTKYAVY